jgi:hypothetical protein
MQRVSLAIVSINVIGALVAPNPARAASIFTAGDATGGSWAHTGSLKTARSARPTSMVGHFSYQGEHRSPIAYSLIAAGGGCAFPNAV